MAKATAEIKAKVKDDASKKIEGIGGALVRLDKAMEGVNKAGAAFGTILSGMATGQIAEVARHWIEMWHVQETAEAKVMAMAQNNEVFRDRGDLLIQWAGQWQKITKFADEDIMHKVIAPLLAFEGFEDDQGMARAIQVSLDAAAATKYDLRSVTQAVGKALQDPFRAATALQHRYGIQFDKQTQEALKALAEINDVETARELVLKKLEERYAGVAEALANTDFGGWEDLQNIWGDIKESFGKALEEIIAPIKAVSTAILEWVQNMSEGQKKAILLVVGVLAIVGTVITLTGALKTLGITFTATMGWWGAVILILTIMALFVIDKWETIQHYMMLGALRIKQAFHIAVAAILNSFIWLIDKLSFILNPLIGLISKVFGIDDMKLENATDKLTRFRDSQLEEVKKTQGQIDYASTAYRERMDRREAERRKRKEDLEKSPVKEPKDPRTSKEIVEGVDTSKDDKPKKGGQKTAGTSLLVVLNVLSQQLVMQQNIYGLMTKWDSMMKGKNIASEQFNQNARIGRST